MLTIIKRKKLHANGVPSLTVVLICMYLMTNNAYLGSFHVLISHAHIFFGEVYVQIFGPFLKLGYSFSYCVLRLFIYSKRVLHQIRILQTNTFCALSSIILTVSFKEQTLWIFMPYNLSISSFMDHAFSVCCT